MATNISATPNINCSPEVLSFAAKCGIDAAVPKILQITKDVFPSATEIRVFTENDWEDPNERALVFEVHVNRNDVSDIVEVHGRWSNGVSTSVPPSVVCPLVLAFEWTE